MLPFTALATATAITTGFALSVSVSYLLLLSGAAACRLRHIIRQSSFTAELLPPVFRHVTVIVPAHDEELVLADTLRSLSEQQYDPRGFTVLVIADNCTDHTAEIARSFGATVWERTNDRERGKGYALAWAVDRLLAQPEPSDAFFIVDADTQVAPDFLMILSRRLFERQDDRGRCALQGRYGVLNKNEGWRAGLMGAAFDLVNHVRPLGADTLGFSVDLKGNGMGFTRAVFEQSPWSGQSITEDLDYGLDLLEKQGVAVGYVPEARVWAQMPTNAQQAASQRDRWERGRRLLTKQRAFPLLLSGLRRGDMRLVEAGGRLLVPPFAELAALLLVWSFGVILGVATGPLYGPGYVWIIVTALLWTGLSCYLLGGLRTAGASSEAYKALLYAPFYAVWKLVGYVAARARQRGSGQEAWVRTARNAANEIITPR